MSNSGEYQVGPLNSIADVLSGFAFKSQWFKSVGDKIIRIGDIINEQISQENCVCFDASKYKIPKYCITQEGDLLMALSGATTGKIGIVETQASGLYVNQRIAIIRGKNQENKKYLKYVFSGENLQKLLLRAGGAAQANLSPNSLREMEIPLPPLPEQKRIAAILDKADAIRRKRRQAIQLADEYLRAVFLDMFGDPVINPKGLEMGFVGENLSFLTSGSRGWAKYYSNRGRLFLRIQNVGSNRLLLDDVAFVNPPDSAESKRTMVKPGDVLISITADLGRTAVIPSKFQIAHINQHLAILRFNHVEPIYASAFLASKGGQHQIQKLNREGVKAGLNFDDIKSLKLLLPPKDLQKRWVEIFQRVQTQRLTFHGALIKADALFNSLTQHAFRGEL